MILITSCLSPDFPLSHIWNPFSSSWAAQVCKSPCRVLCVFVKASVCVCVGSTKTNRSDPDWRYSLSHSLSVFLEQSNKSITSLNHYERRIIPASLRADLVLSLFVCALSSLCHLPFHCLMLYLSFEFHPLIEPVYHHALSAFHFTLVKLTITFLGTPTSPFPLPPSAQDNRLIRGMTHMATSPEGLLRTSIHKGSV